MSDQETEMTENEIDDVLKEVKDPAAPFGRFRNGNPRKRPAKPGGATSVPAPGKRTGSKAKAKAAEPPDYTAIAKANVQMIAGLVGIGATITRKSSLALDSATLIVHAEPMAQGWGQAALDDARIAGWLEKMGSIGTVSAALGPTIAVCAQLLVNHGRLPAGAMGTVAPEKLMERAEEIARSMGAAG
jgi:hypothetical protein